MTIFQSKEYGIKLQLTQPGNLIVTQSNIGGILAKTIFLLLYISQRIVMFPSDKVTTNHLPTFQHRFAPINLT